MSGEPLRILVLTSSTGGGHDSRARALRAWAERAAAGPWEIQLHQSLEETHGLFRFGVWIYNVIQRTWPRLHHIYYNILETISFTGGKDGNVMGGDAFKEAVRAARPHLVVSTHDHLNHGFFAAARAALPEAPPKCATYCTELCGGYGFSRHWVNPEADLFIGAVEEVCQQARELGMAGDRIYRGGFLLDPAFWEPRDEAADAFFLRDTLKLEPGRFTLLLSTGANSAQNHVAWLNALVRSAPPRPLQVVALCGRDRLAKAVVEEWAEKNPALPVCALGHFPNLAQLLRVASAVVARPGTGTTSESILSGTPILFNTLGGIMPQEMITVKFCRAHGFGHVLNRPADLAPVVHRWLAEPAVFAAERAKVIAARPDRTPADILARLRQLVAS